MSTEKLTTEDAATFLESETDSPTVSFTPHPNSDELKHKIIEGICQVYDPEIPVNIYALGLIYDVAIDQEGTVTVTMTLTSPTCPAAQILPAQVQEAGYASEEIKEVVVNLVWDPPWTKDCMSEEAKLELGLL